MSLTGEGTARNPMILFDADNAGWPAGGQAAAAMRIRAAMAVPTGYEYEPPQLKLRSELTRVVGGGGSSAREAGFSGVR
jgi:hypothetical protein